MTTLKHENKANIGDTIRANDFGPRLDNQYYIEGKVLDKGVCDNKFYKCYKIALTKKVVNSMDVTSKTQDKIWYVPFEIDFDEHDTRITKINK